MSWGWKYIMGDKSASFFVLWNWWEFISFYLQALLHVKNLEEVRFSAEVFCKCHNSDNSFLPFSLHRFLEFRSPPNSYYLELYSLKVYNYWNVAFVANKATITLVQSLSLLVQSYYPSSKIELDNSQSQNCVLPVTLSEHKRQCQQLFQNKKTIQVF